MTSERDQLRKTLSAGGVAEDAPVRETLGRGPERAVPSVSTFPAADVDLHAHAEFMLRTEIGRGGMATVWSAQQTALGREVALKRAVDPGDRESELLLLREAIITAQLEHPNIVPVHQLVVDARGPTVVMKRIAGKTWDMLIEDPRVSLETHVDVFLQALNAVDFAHSRGVLHRDIKPQNVMIGDYGEVYLLDWGVARRKVDPPSSAIVGTPCYMAPEMADGLSDERTDVFLLGATLHEVLTGEPRHEGEGALDVLYAAMYVEPYAYSASVPSELAEICNRACARAPDARFVGVSMLREAVLRYREHRAASTLTDAAAQLLMQLRADIAAEMGNTTEPEKEGETRLGYSEVQRRFGETRIAYGAALRVWPENPSAISGLTNCLETMIGYELSLRHLEAAEALCALLQRPNASLQAQVAALRGELESERMRLLGLERDRDPNVGAIGRLRAYLGMGGVTALMTLVLFARRLLLPEQALSTFRLCLVGALVLIIMLVVALLWKRLGAFNLINRRIAEISVSTLAVSFANRLSGYLTDTAAERVLTADAFLLGLGGIALAPYHRAGPWLASMSFLVALLGTLYPSIIDELFIALSVLVPAAILLLKREELRTRSDGAPTSGAVADDPVRQSADRAASEA